LPKTSLSSAVEARLVARAKSLIEQVDIADARLLLKYGSDKGSARATFMLAETYDSQTLRSLQAYGVSGDTAMARKLYELAAAAGIDQARERLESLNAKPEH
jgi:TPR repeat protein